MVTRPHSTFARIWVKTNIKCPVCGGEIFRESLTDGYSPFDNFGCQSIGCPFTFHPMNQYALTLWDLKDSIKRCRKRVQIIGTSVRVKAYSNIIPNSIHIVLPQPTKFKIVDPRCVWVRGADFTVIKLKAGEYRNLVKIEQMEKPDIFVRDLLKFTSIEKDESIKPYIKLAYLNNTVNDIFIYSVELERWLIEHDIEFLIE